MFKSFKELKVWQKAYRLSIPLSRDLGFLKDEESKLLQKEVGDVERMLKGLIKSLNKKS